MPQITSITASTELEAINTMLRAIGLVPALQADLDDLNGDDITNAVGVLRDATREVLSQGWLFNTKLGKELSPTATYAWLDSSGVTTPLNVFKKPAGVLAWSLTNTHKNYDIDLVETLSERYQEAAVNVLVLFDRVRNRDGVEQVRYPHIYLDLILSMNFEQMPESARRYALCKAARRFIRDTGEQGLSRLAEFDENAAFRQLNREHIKQSRLNFFDTADDFNMTGQRPMIGGGGSRRVYPQ